MLGDDAYHECRWPSLYKLTDIGNVHFLETPTDEVLSSDFFFGERLEGQKAD